MSRFLLGVAVGAAGLLAGTWGYLIYTHHYQKPALDNDSTKE